MRSLHAQSRRFWFYEPPESFAEAAERHGAVVNQITDRNAEAAAAAVKDLFAFLQLQTKRTLDRRPTT